MHEQYRSQLSLSSLDATEVKCYVNRAGTRLESHFLIQTAMGAACPCAKCAAPITHVLRDPVVEYLQADLEDEYMVNEEEYERVNDVISKERLPAFKEVWEEPSMTGWTKAVGKRKYTNNNEPCKIRQMHAQGLKLGL